MTNKTFIVASTGNRKEGLIKLITSLIPFFNTGWGIVVVGQCYSEEDARDVKHTMQKFVGRNGKSIFLNQLIGPHSAKIIAMNATESDIWCSLDDDMFAIASTNYDKMANILLQRNDIGFLSGNWGRTLTMAESKNVNEDIVPQKLVFTGGGLMFRDDVADIIRAIPNEKYLFDDCLWAMYAYINGYSNYRYFGSIAVHRICTKGGRKTWLKETKDRIIPPKEYINCRKCNDLDGYYICMDKDLTALAHELHKKNLKIKEEK